jgi:hypothetical protein
MKNQHSLIKDLKVNFPALSEGFYNALLERVRVHQFTEEEFGKAVYHVIDTFTGNDLPKIANFILHIHPDGMPPKPIKQPSPKEIQEQDEASKAYDKRVEDFNNYLLNTPIDEL